MLQYTDQLLEIYRKMEFDLNSFSDTHKGLLHLGASTTISQYVIPSALAEFHKKYKDVEVKLLNGNTEQIEQALLNNDIDLGERDIAFAGPGLFGGRNKSSRQ